MRVTKKAKVSVTISRDLLAQIDAYAARTGVENRSNVIELWLRRVAREQSALQLEKDTIDYYESLGTNDDDARRWSNASTAAFSTLDID
jgi:metal-responsive CopG/Arc/MetJ family transcriptional regulator